MAKRVEPPVDEGFRVSLVEKSHHTYSVAKYPHLANLGQLIYPATRNEHKNRWHGSNFKTSLPGCPMNIIIKEDF
jgi:hypothetical protein